MAGGLRGTVRYSTLPHLVMKLDHWLNSRSCTYILFLTWRIDIKLIFALRPIWLRLLRYKPIFNNAILFHESPKLYILPFSTPTNWNWPYFHSTAPVSKIQGHFKIAIFGHETRQLAKVPEVANTRFSKNWNWDYFCYTDIGFRNTGRFSKFPYIFRNETYTLHIHSLSTRMGEIDLIFILGATVIMIEQLVTTLFSLNRVINCYHYKNW